MQPILAMAAWVVAIPPAGLLLVFALEAFAGLRRGPVARPTGVAPRVAVLIPAHNESGGIAATLEALFGTAPRGTRVLVVADNCSDDTAAVARRAGAEVVERVDADRRGKGYALAFGRDHLVGDPPDAVLVLDADCRLAPGGVERLAEVAVATGAPAQAINTIAPDLAAPPMVQISSFAMLVKNRVRSQGMVRMGGAALLTGTGMAFPWPLFADAPLATGDIVEDLGLGIELTRAGLSPRLVPEASVTSAPAHLKDTLAQRTRWEHGFLSTARRLALPMVAEAIRAGSRARLLLGLHLLVPPLALLLAAASALLALAALLGAFGAGWGPALLLGVTLAVAVAATFAAWVAVGRGTLSAAALLRAPLYVLWKIPLYLRFLRGAETRWVRTRREHEGGGA